MSDHRREKTEEMISHTASEFIARESSNASMITVTNIVCSQDMKKATILVSVFPETQTVAALDFLKRQRSEFKNFFKEKSRMHPVPLFDFQIDLGEKSRQRVEDITLNL